MNRLAAIIAIVLTLFPAVVLAQMVHQPYAGLQGRPIKSLSDQEVGDLRAGRGMGLALAAELNGYPGPAHVLELADSLGLSQEQRAKMQGLFAAMKAETIPIGQKLIAQETDLDRQFAGKTISEASLTSAMQLIAATQGSLRAAHLKYHLAAAEILTPTQIKQYAELRGYSRGPQAGHQHGGHQP
jgi:hypothetical protein